MHAFASEFFAYHLSNPHRPLAPHTLLQRTTHLTNSLGRGAGFEEIKAHPWLKNVDFDTLRQQPAPYLPLGSAEIKSLLDYLKSSGPAVPLDESMLKKLTVNFDDFTDDESQMKGAGPVGASCFPQAAPPTRQEFIGYTFKRKKDTTARASLAGAFDQS